jgi:hypothetical protein
VRLTSRADKIVCATAGIGTRASVETERTHQWVRYRLY